MAATTITGNHDGDPVAAAKANIAQQAYHVVKIL